MQFSGFEWDDGNWPKCAKHGVSKAEIEHTLLNEPAVFPDRNSHPSETRFNAVGKNGEGRYLFVVFTFRQRADEHLLRPISARYMHAKEIEQYERR
jgi:uncharacterized DUF497 family protein